MLAAVAAGAVDQAVLLTGAGVGRIALLTPPEEALRTENTNGYLMKYCDGGINPRLHSDSTVTSHSLFSSLMNLFHSER